METSPCIFCKIIDKDLAADIVYQDEDVIAFLDNRPLFPGHVLLCPIKHYETLPDLPPDLACSVMHRTQMLAHAAQAATKAEGTFIAINNRISQSVPHLHIHVVPRRKGDGLRGFFWPRQKYQDDIAREAMRAALEREIALDKEVNASR